MTNCGKFILKYEPPVQSCSDHAIEMSMPSHATTQQMLEFFQSFLKAAGYEIGGKELCLQRSAPDFSDVPEKWGNFWEEDGVSLTGNPTASGDTVVSGSGTPGGWHSGSWFPEGNDVISFGSPQAAHNFETGAKTWDDVITLG